MKQLGLSPPLITYCCALLALAPVANCHMLSTQLTDQLLVIVHSSFSQRLPMVGMARLHLDAGNNLAMSVHVLRNSA